ncbi:interleukin-1 receptor type 1-like [Pseudophryne corroboree]|uniref:interleukin-1 receptor type 1-like n=1 Tax=Pseudophryne corroboree TaxID=495146 RepID=UPI0030817381
MDHSGVKGLQLSKLASLRHLTASQKPLTDETDKSGFKHKYSYCYPTTNSIDDLVWKHDWSLQFPSMYYTEQRDTEIVFTAAQSGDCSRLNLMPLLIFSGDEVTLHYLCEDDGVEPYTELVAEGQPIYVTCPLLDSEDKTSNFSVTWLKNGSQTEITSDIQMRVHQDQNYLKFIPARLDDTGYYACVLRSSTYCKQIITKVKVFKNDDGLCYNHDQLYSDNLILGLPLTIECPKIDNFFKIKWFKECQPLELDGNKYYASRNLLNIKNVTLLDKGYYTCEATVKYNDTEYIISRTIHYSIKVLQSAPAIINPKNNFLQAKLGAAISLKCEVLCSGYISLYWTVDDSVNYTYSDDGRVVMGEKKFTDEGNQVLGKSLNFSKVKEEDYNRKFYCNIYSEIGQKAFVMLKHPEPNFQGLLIALFVAIVSIIVIAVITIRVFKVEIVLWYRSSYFARTDYKDGKIYDAYIMYPKNVIGTSCHNMDIFVVKVLPEVLEKQCDYRLFIIGRDDLPGQAIADLVDEAISQSRRLIIVLGEISSEKGLGDDFEQKIAMYDALIRNKIKVILIELEKITNYTYMPESIQYIKQKQGVVRWKGEFTEESLHRNTKFWKNIRYRMPQAQHPSDRKLDYIGSEN